MKVHLIPVLVFDFEGYGLKGCAELLENVKYLDHTHPQLGRAQTVEVEWSDDHPLNQKATAEAERNKLFPSDDEWRAAVHDALLPLGLAETPRASVAKLVEWTRHIATAPELQQPFTEDQHKAFREMVKPKAMAPSLANGDPTPTLPSDLQWFEDPDSSFPRFNLTSEPRYYSYSDVEPGHFYGVLLSSGKVRIYYKGFNDPDLIHITQLDSLAEGCEYLRASLGSKPKGVDSPIGM